MKMTTSPPPSARKKLKAFKPIGGKPTPVYEKRHVPPGGCVFLSFLKRDSETPKKPLDFKANGGIVDKKAGRYRRAYDPENEGD